MKQLMDMVTPFPAVAKQIELPGKTLPWLNQLRLKALTQFNKNGLPSKKEEDWKYTSLWPLTQQTFQHQPEPLELSTAQIDSLALMTDAYRIVLIDGVFSPQHSRLEDLPQGLLIRPFSQALAWAQPHLGKQVDLTRPGLNALNTMLMQEGVVISMEDNIRVEKPVELLMIQSGKTENLACHLRNVIVLGRRSQLSLIEHYVGLSEAASFTNVISEVVLAVEAQLEHYKLQRESRQAFHIAGLSASQAAGSQWQICSVSLGGLLARHDFQTQLKGARAQANMDGLYVVAGDQHVDHHIRIDHCVADTGSQALFKGVMDEHSHAVFNGKVIVHPHAQKTDANQQNHNLLLSRSCEIDSKPEMEIYADDVKCGHGSTVGQLNEDHLFFLRARGLDEVAARSLLMYAFAAEVLEQLPNKAVSQALASVLERHLPQGAVS